MFRLFFFLIWILLIWTWCKIIENSACSLFTKRACFMFRLVSPKYQPLTARVICLSTLSCSVWDLFLESRRDCAQGVVVPQSKTLCSNLDPVFEHFSPLRKIQTWRENGRDNQVDDAIELTDGRLKSNELKEDIKCIVGAFAERVTTGKVWRRSISRAARSAKFDSRSAEVSEANVYFDIFMSSDNLSSRAIETQKVWDTHW